MRLSGELLRRDEFINVYKSACEFYEVSENQYRATINLYEDRIKRFRERILIEERV